MVFRETDRTAEIERGFQDLCIYPTDFCCYYKKHPYTELWKEECWTCMFGDFGIESGDPTNTGTCRYKKRSKDI